MTTPLTVGALLRASIPYAGSEHPVMFRILEEKGGALRVRSVPSPGAQKEIEAWVAQSEIALLMACELVELLGYTVCDECGAQMELVTDGTIQTGDGPARPAPFVACTGCDNCYEVAGAV